MRDILLPWPKGIHRTQRFYEYRYLSRSKTTKSAERAAAEVRSGGGTVALYLNGLRPEDVFRATEAGEVMPQKSTFFAPKIPTGLVFRVEDQK